MQWNHHIRYSVMVLLRFVLLVASIAVITFLLAYLAPVNPVDAFLGQQSVTSDEQRALIAREWGLDKAPLARFLLWMKGIFRGDWGTSYLYQRPVLEIISAGFRNSALLMMSAWIFSGVLGVLLGIVAAANEGGAADKMIKTLCYVFSATPAFWVGILFLLVFSVALGIFPIGLSAPVGMSADEAGIIEKMHHAFLPSLTLSITGISHITMYTRESMCRILRSDFALFSRARGCSKAQIIVRHGLRNMLLPVITVQCSSINEIFGGSVLVESVFTYAGLGSVTVSAGVNGDMPLLMGITIISAAIVFSGNALANLLYPLADPRIESRKVNN